MATIADLKRALIKADQSGDIEAAGVFASLIKKSQAEGLGETSQLILPKEKKERSIGETLKGAGETALTLATGATGGAVGAIGGTLGGLAESIGSGQYGTQQGAELVKQRQAEGAQALTYAPKTQAGQEMAAGVAEFLAPLEAFGGLTGELQAIGALSKASRPLIQAKAMEAAPKITAPLKGLKGKAEAVMPQRPTEITPENIGEVAQKAAAGSVKAKVKLAEEAKVNPEAMKAAERLDIDMPIDVWSDSELVKQTAGLTRSQIGPESAAWREMVQNAANKADEAMQSLGGAESKATVSGKVQDALTASRNDLKNQASTLYGEVDTAIPKQSEITPSNLQKTLNDISTEVGGADMMSATEKNLLKSVTDGATTYGGLLRMKSLVGDALSGKQVQNPFGSIDTGSLKRLYGAIKNDQLDAAEALGGIETRDKLHFANRLTVKQKALEDRMIGAFGKEGEGSIASLMTRAVEQGAKGDITAFNKLLKAVPKDMHKEVVATALSDMATSARAVEGGMFDFAKFAKTYNGLRKNAPIYKQVIESVGSDKHQMLSDLYQVSKRITDARANVLTTGKANQAILKGMQSEGLISKIIGESVAWGVKKATAGTVSPEALFKSPADKVREVGEMLRSKEFKDLAVEAATSKPSEVAIKKFTGSKQFKVWANAIAKRSKNTAILANPNLWVMEALTFGSQDKKKEAKGF